MKRLTIINEFKTADNVYLSSFYPIKIEYDNLTYRSAESAYWAQKCTDFHDRVGFMKLTGIEARRLGRTIHREDWNEQTALYTMYLVNKTKFDQHPNLKEKLLSTGDLPLVNGNLYGDAYWGFDVYRQTGKNMLGKILMRIRKEYSNLKENNK